MVNQVHGIGVIEDFDGQRHSCGGPAHFESEKEAEQQAVALALRIVKGDILPEELFFGRDATKKITCSN